MKLSDREWREFYIGDLFLVRRPNARNKDFYEEGEVPFVASGSTNNGVMKCCKAQEDETLDKGRCITVSPVDGSAFYQPYSFLGRGGAGSSILMLYKQGLNLYTGQFIAKMIANTCMSKYTYGHMGNKDSIKRERIMLPVDNNKKPDYQFMEDYIKELMAAKRKQYQNYVEKRLAEIDIKRSGGYEQYLDKKDWQDYTLTGKNGLFPIQATSTGIDAIRLKEGDKTIVPYITRTDTNNGIAKFISSKNYDYGKDTKKCITIGLDTQTAYWQTFDFVTGQNIHVLRSNLLNLYSGQFIAMILRGQMKSKFNWGGNGATLGRLKKLKIMLPVKNDKKPDYEFMEAYGRRMMAKKYLQYLHYLAKIIAKEALD